MKTPPTWENVYVTLSLYQSRYRYTLESSIKNKLDKEKIISVGGSENKAFKILVSEFFKCLVLDTRSKWNNARWFPI